MAAAGPTICRVGQKEHLPLLARDAPTTARYSRLGTSSLPSIVCYGSERQPLSGQSSHPLPHPAVSGSRAAMASLDMMAVHRTPKSIEIHHW
jgi:hypothetical protein